MKHTSLALAVGAVILGTAASASAQSSVTIFGVMDAAIVRSTGSIASTTRMNTSEALGSRLGFRGTEDLGGGLSANFMLEAGLLNDTGAGAATNSNNQASGSAGGGGLTFNRQAWMGLLGKFGEVRLGREYTPTFSAFALNDPFGGNGSMVMSQAWQGAIGGLVLANAVRTSNGVSYQTPAAWGPVRAHLLYALSENASNAGATARPQAFA